MLESLFNEVARKTSTDERVFVHWKDCITFFSLQLLWKNTYSIINRHSKAQINFLELSGNESLDLRNFYGTTHHTQKMKFSVKDLFSKCDQIRSFLRIWSHLPKKSWMENLIFVQWKIRYWFIFTKILTRIFIENFFLTFALITFSLWKGNGIMIWIC